MDGWDWKLFKWPAIQNPKILCSLLTGVLEYLSTSSADGPVQLHSFGTEEWSTRSNLLCHFSGLTVLCSNEVCKFYLPLCYAKDWVVLLEIWFVANSTKDLIQFLTSFWGIFFKEILFSWLFNKIFKLCWCTYHNDIWWILMSK